MTTIIEEVTEVVRISEAEQGPAGPAGPTGPSGTGDEITRTAAEPISGHTVVATSGASGQLVPADSADTAMAPAVLGIITSAVEAGASVTVRAQGEVEESGWSWTPGQFIFCGADGVLTQTPPSSGFLLIVGWAMTPTRMFVRLMQPVYLT